MHIRKDQLTQAQLRQCLAYNKRKDNSTGHPGVWLNKLNARKKFMSELTLNGERVHYASHYSLEEAIAARKQAENQHGFHANHGIPKP